MTNCSGAAAHLATRSRLFTLRNRSIRQIAHIPLCQLNGLVLPANLRYFYKVWGFAHIRRVAYNTPTLALLSQRIDWSLALERKSVPLGTRSSVSACSRPEQHPTNSLDVLPQAACIFAKAIDAESAFSGLAELCAREMADWAFATLLGERCEIRQLCVSCARFSCSDLAEQLRQHCLFGALARDRSVSVLSTLDQPLLLNRLTGRSLVRLADGLDHSKLLRKAQIRSMLLVPMFYRDRLFGILTLFRCKGRRGYSASDLAAARALSAWSSMALDTLGQLQRANKRKLRLVKEIERRKNVAAGVGHELRNALAPINGWTTSFKSNSVLMSDATLSAGINAIERNVATLARLTEDCLGSVRLRKGQMSLEREPLNLNHVVSAAIEDVRHLARAKGVHFVEHLSDSPLRANGDALRLRQVFTNVLINGVNYTEENGTVTISSRLRGEQAEVEVGDTGAGIEPSLLEEIFQPFQRGKNTDQPVSESGMGLGLAIARNLVLLHGGKIWAESEGPGHGSTFYIRLPLSGPVATGRMPLPIARPIESRHPVRILLVEDAYDVLTAIKMELETLGHRVFTATNGIDAVETARRELPDLLISDLKMPGLNGYDLIRQIRSTYQVSYIPAIALTGAGRQEGGRRAIAAGFDTCLSKLADLNELSNAIANLTAQQRTCGQQNGIA
ncbi:MAG: luxQ 1 [Bryobacterales bacterium]|nr:luxQ 1 [Bryobacterales bacterium]